MYTCCLFDIYISNKFQHYSIHAQCISIIYIYISKPMTAESPKTNVGMYLVLWARRRGSNDIFEFQAAAVGYLCPH